MSYNENNYGQPQGSPNNGPYSYGQPQGNQNNDPYSYGQPQGNPNNDPYSYGQSQGNPNNPPYEYGQPQGNPNNPPYEYGQSQGNPNNGSYSYGQPQNNYNNNQYNNSYGYNQQPYYSQPVKKSNGAATASLIMGIISLTGCLSIFSIPGLICGIIGRKKDKKSGKALAGIITSIIGLLIAIAIIVLSVSDSIHISGNFYGPGGSISSPNGFTKPGSSSVDQIDGIHFSINDYVMTIGETTVDEIENGLGITIDQSEKDYILSAKSYYSVNYFLDDDYNSISFFFANKSDESKPISECKLYRVKVTTSYYLEGQTIDYLTFDLGSGITEKTADISSVRDILGDEDYEYISDSFDTQSYEFYSYFNKDYMVTVEFNVNGMHSFTIGEYY